MSIIHIYIIHITYINLISRCFFIVQHPWNSARQHVQKTWMGIGPLPRAQKPPKRRRSQGSGFSIDPWKLIPFNWRKIESNLPYRCTYMLYIYTYYIYIYICIHMYTYYIYILIIYIYIHIIYTYYIFSYYIYVYTYIYIHRNFLKLVVKGPQMSHDLWRFVPSQCVFCTCPVHWYFWSMGIRSWGFSGDFNGIL